MLAPAEDAVMAPTKEATKLNYEDGLRAQLMRDEFVRCEDAPRPGCQLGRENQPRFPSP